MRHDLWMAGALAALSWTSTAGAEPPKGQEKVERSKVQEAPEPKQTNARCETTKSEDGSDKRDAAKADARRAAPTTPEGPKPPTQPATEMNAAAALAAGEAARQEAEHPPPHEAQALLQARAPKSQLAVGPEPELTVVRKPEDPEGKEHLELGARSSKPVVVPPYDNGSPPAAPASQETPAERALREHVQSYLWGHQKLSRSERMVHVRVSGQTVILSGQVGTTLERERVAKTVQALPQVKQVRNEIQSQDPLNEKPRWDAVEPQSEQFE